MSSTQAPSGATQSLIHLPHWPYRRHFHGARIVWPGTRLEQLDLLAGIPRFAVVADQARLVIERVALAGGTGHEQLNDALGFRGEVRSGEQSVGIKQTGQGDSAESAAELPQKLPAISVVDAAVNAGIACRHGFASLCPLTLNPSPPSTGERGANVNR